MKLKKLKLKLFIPLCETCEKTIASYGLPCISLIEKVCSYYTNSKPIIYSENHASTSGMHTVIKFMENKGYLVSKEVDQDRIYLYPKVKPGKKRGCYCWCPGETRL